jgi:hypothetical protein
MRDRDSLHLTVRGRRDHSSRLLRWGWGNSSPIDGTLYVLIRDPST